MFREIKPIGFIRYLFTEAVGKFKLKMEVFFLEIFPDFELLLQFYDYLIMFRELKLIGFIRYLFTEAVGKFKQKLEAIGKLQ